MFPPLTAAGESSGAILLKVILGRRAGIWMILFVMNYFAESGFMPPLAIILMNKRLGLRKGSVYGVMCPCVHTFGLVIKKASYFSRAIGYPKCTAEIGLYF